MTTALHSAISHALPSSPEIEQAVLGTLLLFSDTIADVGDLLRPEVFFVAENACIWSAIATLYRRRDPIDILTVTTTLRNTGHLESVGGPFYIAQLTNNVASSANIQYHARILIQLHMRREQIRIGQTLVERGYSELPDVFDSVADASSDLRRLTEFGAADARPMSAIVPEAMDRNAKDRSAAFGFDALDQKIRLEPGTVTIIGARPAMGKCLGKGTKVLMFDGTLKNVEDVVVGDRLMGDDSTPRNVLSLARGREKMYQVHQNHGISYRVNESHILSLKRSRREGGHTHGEVLNIGLRDYLSRSPKFRSSYKGYKVPVEFPEQELPIDPYFLGLWLGDGTASNVTISNPDAEIINWLRDYAGRMGMRCNVAEVKGKCPLIAVVTNKGKWSEITPLQSVLRANGLLGNKHIPHVYLANSAANRLALLAGLLDSDGHYNAEFNVYEITQKNEELARSIKFLCDTLGFKTSIRTKKASIKERGFETTVYRVRISGHLDRVPVRVERKKARPRPEGISPLHTGITVEYDKVDDYYGFTIDGNRLFLLEDMTVTHNTSFMLSSAWRQAQAGMRPYIVELEMRDRNLARRLVCGETGVPIWKSKRNQLNEQELDAMAQWHITHGDAQDRMLVDEAATMTVASLAARLDRAKRKQGIDMVWIDYLGLLQPSTRTKGAYERMTAISNELRVLAKEIDLPFAVLAQLSRPPKGATPKPPALTDLRDSGEIEQDAEAVCFLHRPKYYDPTAGDEVQFIIAKYRDGGDGMAELAFDAAGIRIIDKHDAAAFTQFPPRINAPF